MKTDKQIWQVGVNLPVGTGVNVVVFAVELWLLLTCEKLIKLCWDAPHFPLSFLFPVGILLLLGCVYPNSGNFTSTSSLSRERKLKISWHIGVRYEDRVQLPNRWQIVRVSSHFNTLTPMDTHTQTSCLANCSHTNVVVAFFNFPNIYISSSWLGHWLEWSGYGSKKKTCWVTIGNPPKTSDLQHIKKNLTCLVWSDESCLSDDFAKTVLLTCICHVCHVKSTFLSF